MEIDSCRCWRWQCRWLECGMCLLLGRSDRDGGRIDKRCGIIKDLGWLHWEPDLGPIIRLEDDYFVRLAKLERRIPKK